MIRRLTHGLAVLATIGILACATGTITAIPFGRLDTVQLYTLTNRNGLVARITNYGAIVTELHVPDRDGRLADVVLGFDNLDGYLAGHPYFGAIVGRVANRIRNAEFTLEGTRYTLDANDKPHHLHGGRTRSEERRVGKECRSRWWQYH